MPQATGLVAELHEAFAGKVQTKLIKGDNGVFEVVLDGDLVYSKKQTGQFPRYREIPNVIEQKMIRS